MSMDFSINAVARADVGKGASRRLRHAGLTPAIVYGGDAAPVAVTLKHNAVLQHIEHEAFFSHILDLNVDGKTEKVVLRDMQRHPAKRMVMHLDFQRVTAQSRIHMRVPLHFINEDDAPGVRGGGAVSHHVIEVEVSCLPKDLPEYIEVDMGGMQIGDSVHLSDLAVPAGVTLTALAQGEGHDSAVAGVHAARTAVVEEEEAPAAEEAKEGEADSAGTKAGDKQ